MMIEGLTIVAEAENPRGVITQGMIVQFIQGLLLLLAMTMDLATVAKAVDLGGVNDQEVAQSAVMVTATQSTVNEKTTAQLFIQELLPLLAQPVMMVVQFIQGSLALQMDHTAVVEAALHVNLGR
jgi:hypothetical protein